MSVRYRREEYAESTRKAIVEAALELFASRGYVHTSLDEVAEHARVSKGAIYHHFSNKRDVFEAVLQMVISGHVRVLRNQVAKVADTSQAMTELLDYYLDICIDPLFSRLVLQEGPIAFGWVDWREFEREFILDSFIEPAEQWVREGVTVPVSAGMLLRTLTSAIHEMALTIIDSPEPQRATMEARALIKELVASLVRPAADANGAAD